MCVCAVENRPLCVCVCGITGFLQPCQRGQLTSIRLDWVGCSTSCGEPRKGQRQWRETSVPIPTLLRHSASISDVERRLRIWSSSSLAAQAQSICWHEGISLKKGKKEKCSKIHLLIYVLTSRYFIKDDCLLIRVDECSIYGVPSCCASKLQQQQQQSWQREKKQRSQSANDPLPGRPTSYCRYL